MAQILDEPMLSIDEQQSFVANSFKPIDLADLMKPQVLTIPLDVSGSMSDSKNVDFINDLQKYMIEKSKEPHPLVFKLKSLDESPIPPLKFSDQDFKIGASDMKDATYATMLGILMKWSQVLPLMVEGIPLATEEEIRREIGTAA